MTKNSQRLAASFRDPSGFLFRRDGVLFRQVNQQYTLDYDLLMDSGLYENLTKVGVLIPHEEVDVDPLEPGIAYKVIQPALVEFVSYPYEWSFGLLKEAALATLSIQKRALKRGMTLKDASAYNIQFVNGKAALIDTLSFEAYEEGKPWDAYRQFCQHFLAPLALMAHVDIRLNGLSRNYIDGVPLDLAAKLLPGRTRLNFGLLSHLHLHARMQTQQADKAPSGMAVMGGMRKEALIGLIDSLRNTVKKLEWKPGGTEWGDYYEITNYTDAGAKHKADIITKWLDDVKPEIVWDLGANDGTFSRLASERDIFTVAFDIDPTAVEKNYRQIKAQKEKNLVPLVLDLTNPSPAIGWHNQERDSLVERAPAEMVFALALIHHLAISNNLPLGDIARFFADAGKWLVIEFVPKSDSQVQKLLQSRKDIFNHYTLEDFEASFGEYFFIREKVAIMESERFLFLLEKKA
jgi:hypothetical protein